jgi:glutamate carboxypeptidase
LCFEPSLPNGNLVSARKGSGNFSIQISGRAAHAGRDHAKGRNAIAAMSQVITTLDNLNGQHNDMTINVGFIDGGGSVNVVPDECLLRVNVRVSNADQMRAFENTLHTLIADINQRDGLTAQIEGGFHRPPKVMTVANEALLLALRECGSQLGLDLKWQATGGCCDGNNLAHHGLANVDNLGVRGDLIHSDQEYCLVDSLSERAKLSALLLMKLANRQIDPALFGKPLS